MAAHTGAVSTICICYCADSIIVSCFLLLFMFIPPFRLGVMDIKLGVGVLCVCALIRRS